MRKWKDTTIYYANARGRRWFPVMGIRVICRKVKFRKMYAEAKSKADALISGLNWE